jgi:hypothetical protein
MRDDEVMVKLDEMMNIRVLRWMMEEWVVMVMVEDRWLLLEHLGMLVRMDERWNVQPRVLWLLFHDL